MSKFKNAPKSPLKRDAYKPRLVVHKGGSKVLSQDVVFVVFVLQRLAWTWHGPSLPSEVEDELRRKESLGETDLGTSQTTLLAFSISCQGCGLAMSLPCRHLGGAHHLEEPGCLSGLGCPVWSPVAQAIGGGLSGG